MGADFDPEQNKERRIVIYGCFALTAAAIGAIGYVLAAIIQTGGVQPTASRAPTLPVAVLASTSTPQPTYTPYPTFTSVPLTNAPRPTQASPQTDLLGQVSGYGLPLPIELTKTVGFLGQQITIGIYFPNGGRVNKMRVACDDHCTEFTIFHADGGTPTGLQPRGIYTPSDGALKGMDMPTAQSLGMQTGEQLEQRLFIDPISIVAGDTLAIKVTDATGGNVGANVYILDFQPR